MASHMKTTVHIPDALLADVRKIAARNKTTLRALVQEGLMHVVAEQHRRKKRFKLKDMSVGPTEVNESLRDMKWEDMVRFAYGDRSG